MKTEEFITALAASLAERGVPESVAVSQVKKLVASLSGNSIRIIEACDSKESLTPMADELAAKLLRNYPGDAKSSSADAKSGEATAAPDEAKAAEPSDAAAPANSADSEPDPLDRAFGDDEDENAASDDDDGIELIFSRPREEARAQAEPAAEPTVSDDGGDLDYIRSFSAPDTVRPNPAAYQSARRSEADGGVADAPTAQTKIRRAVPKPAQNAASPGAQNAAPAAAKSGAHDAARFAEPDDDDLPDDRDPPEDGEVRSYSIGNDEISMYAPDDAMLTKMGITYSNYEAEAIGDREEKKRGRDELPPLPDIRETREGKKNFLITVICLSPILAAIALVYFGLWGALFAVEIALIAACVAALIAISAGGALVSIAGIIYGVVKLSSQRSEGIFEIGLGIAVAGATLLAGVLIYNFALRFMPWAIRRTAYLFRLATRGMHILIRRIRGRFSKR